MDWLEDEIQDLAENCLVGQKKNEFLRCVEKLKYPRRRPWSISEDSLSGVYGADPDCRNCINNSGIYQARIKICINELLIRYPRN